MIIYTAAFKFWSSQLFILSVPPSSLKNLGTCSYKPCAPCWEGDRVLGLGADKNLSIFLGLLTRKMQVEIMYLQLLLGSTPINPQLHSFKKPAHFFSNEVQTKCSCTRRWISHLFCLCWLQGDAHLFTNPCAPREGFQGAAFAESQKHNSELNTTVRSEWDLEMSDPQQHSTAPATSPQLPRAAGLTAQTRPQPARWPALGCTAAGESGAEAGHGGKACREYHVHLHSLSEEMVLYSGAKVCLLKCSLAVYSAHQAGKRLGHDAGNASC